MNQESCHKMIEGNDQIDTHCLVIWDSSMKIGTNTNVLSHVLP